MTGLHGPDSDATLTGTAGDDRIDGSDLDEVIFGLGGDDLLQGLAGDDALSGGAGDDTLLGGSGNDTLNGNGGHDSLNGGSGDDLIFASDALADAIDGGSGRDTLSFVHAGQRVQALSYAGIENLIGSAFDDVLQLVGGGGVAAGAGDDRVAGSQSLSSGGVRAHGQAGDDTLQAGVRIDTLSGGAGDDTLSTDLRHSAQAELKGGAGADRITSFQADTIDGGGGDDSLQLYSNGAQVTGGAGADTFVVQFLFHPEEAMSLITDLAAEDVIDLSRYDSAKTFTLVETFTHHAYEARLVYDPGADETQLQMDVDGDGVSDQGVRIAGDHTDFTNFIL